MNVRALNCGGVENRVRKTALPQCQCQPTERQEQVSNILKVRVFDVRPMPEIMMPQYTIIVILNKQGERMYFSGFAYLSRRLLMVALREEISVFICAA